MHFCACKSDFKPKQGAEREREGGRERECDKGSEREEGKRE